MLRPKVQSRAACGHAGGLALRIEPARARHLRFTQGIALERLTVLLSDVLGLDISEGAIVNMLDAAHDCFTTKMKAIRARLLWDTALQSDETGLRVGKKH